MTKKKNTRPPTLSEQALWAYVNKNTTTVIPQEEIENIEEDFLQFAAVNTQPLPQRPFLHPRPSKTHHDIKEASLSRKQLNRKAKTRIQNTLDLHGYTEIAAQQRLQEFLLQAHKEKQRMVLIITGKGFRGQGVLRQRLPLWLNLPPLNKIVSSYKSAHQSHGGAGAYYVFLQKNCRVAEFS